MSSPEQPEAAGGWRSAKTATEREHSPRTDQTPGANGPGAGTAGGPAGGETSRPDAALPRPPPWRLRFLVVELLQLPAVGLAYWIPGTTGWWLAAFWGSVVCCAGTDSGWRWRNRLLIAQAVVWLLLALLYAA